MKLSNARLKQIIQEELGAVLLEIGWPTPTPAKTKQNIEDILNNDEIYVYIEDFQHGSGQAFRIEIRKAMQQKKLSLSRKKKYIILSEIKVKEPKAGQANCSGSWEIMWVEAKVRGWGPITYDIAMEYVKLKGGKGLMADRVSVTSAAESVWKYYLKNRGDVNNKQLDYINKLGDKGVFTPEEPEDDCTQLSFIKNTLNSKKFDPNNPNHVTNYKNSPITKTFEKEIKIIPILKKAGKIRKA